MTILESHRVLIGACGWLHDNWQENFYPEDIPPDWYLGYYGNEFPVVMVREKEWQQGSVEEWLEDTDEVPLFICELPLNDRTENLPQHADSYLTAISAMGERCIGIICRANNSANVSEIESVLKASQAVAPTVLAMDDMPAEIQDLISELKINPLWTSPRDNSECGGSLFITCLDASQLKLPGLRTSMENLLAKQSEQARLILLIDGDTPGIEIIKQASVMLDLI